jgi:excisionase family DNA binding protein
MPNNGALTHERREEAWAMTTRTSTVDELVTTREAAWRTGVSKATVIGWIKAGKLPATREGRGYLVRPAEVGTTQAVAHLGIVVPEWRADPAHAGARLRALREAAGLSQLQLAARSRLTHEAISRVELGQRAPQAATIRALAQALEVEPAQFVGYSPLGLALLTTAEAARQLTVPMGRVSTWLRTGKIEGRKVSGQWRVLAITLTELERSGRLRGESRRLDPRFRG